MSFFQSLNGWWDIIPIFDDARQSGVPLDEWQEKSYLVPSSWACSLTGIRKKNEKYYYALDINELPKCSKTLERDWEFLFDNFSYPKIWTLARRAWVRRYVSISDLRFDEKLIIKFNGVLARGTLYINGQLASFHQDPFLPWETDITKMLKIGDNELAVLIEDFELNQAGQTVYPSANCLPTGLLGIWQDVSLLRRPLYQVDDVCIRSMVIDKQLYVKWNFKNCSDTATVFQISPILFRWNANEKWQELLKLENFEVEVAAQTTCEYERIFDGVDLPPWSPASPALCVLQTEIVGGEQHCERFGFREITIDDSNLCLNGVPVHAFSDWGHKFTLLHHHASWIRQWFRMIKDGNMNHSRLHTHPHPTLILDIADEEGIMITGETAIHGSARFQAANEKRFWENAIEHIRNFVKRDKNHPSLIFWSVENEMRWNFRNSADSALSFKMLPEMRKLFNKLDPTRPAYHSGDSSLWNEKDQDIISRHYGKECSGCGWWDQNKPLISEEMSLYHYAGPNNTMHLGGDAVWSDFRNINRAAALDTQYIVEDGRSMGVCNLGPWNQSCLENYRLDSKELNFDYENYESPGIKPLKIKPFSSEFAFWQNTESGSYRPSPSFAIQRESFRPFALIDTSRRCTAYGGCNLKRTIYCVNDLDKIVTGTLIVSLVNKVGKTIFQQKFKLEILFGRVLAQNVSLPLPEVSRTTEYEYQFEFLSSSKGRKVLDRQKRRLYVGRKKRLAKLVGKVKIFGSGKYRDLWQEIGLNPEYITQLSHASLVDTDILLVEPKSVDVNELNMNHLLKKFCLKGGRCLILEQDFSIIPSSPLVNMPLQKIFIRHHNHPVLKGIMEDELCFWGDDPYSQKDSNTVVAWTSYHKDSGSFISILDGGNGNFGSGSMEQSQLLEIPLGAGTVLATQLRLTEKSQEIPATIKLLVNMLQYLDEYQPQTATRTVIIAESVKEAVNLADSGNKVMYTCHATSDVKELNRQLHLRLKLEKPDTVFQAVKQSPEDKLLCGICNEDACGIINWTYGAEQTEIPIGKYFFKVTDGLEPLLVTPTVSVLKEMFVKKGGTEALRAHTLSRFLFEEKPEEFIVIGRIHVGSGEIIINQFLPETLLPRFERLQNMLLHNLGEVKISNALDGTITIGKRSMGYPETIMEHPGLPDSEMFTSMIDATVFQTERMCNTAILNYGIWREQNSPTGCFCTDSLEPRLLFFLVESLKNRNRYDKDLAIPNPEAMTFFEFAGSGKITLYFNGLRQQTCVVYDNETVSIGDIYLRYGFNNVVILWEPDKINATLKISMRNIMHVPETDLIFRYKIG